MLFYIFFKYIKAAFFIIEFLALSSIKTVHLKNNFNRILIEIFISTICLSFYGYSVISIVSGLNFLNLFAESIHNLINVVILLIGIILVLACNFNRYYFANKMRYWFKKFMVSEKELKASKISNNKLCKCYLLAFTYLLIVFCDNSIGLILEFTSYHINGIFGDFWQSFVGLMAYNLHFICTSLSCACLNVFFYILGILMQLSNDGIYKHFTELQYKPIKDKIIQSKVEQIKDLIQILNILCAVKNEFLFMTGLVNIIVFLSILIMTVFYAFFLISTKNFGFQDGFMQFTLVNNLMCTHLAFFILVYVAEKCSIEVNLWLAIIFKIYPSLKTYNCKSQSLWIWQR